MWESQRIASSAGGVRRAPPRALEREAAQMVSKERAPVLEAFWEADSDAERSFPQHPWESWKNALDSLQEEEDILTHQEVCRRSRGVPSWCAVSKMKIPPSSRVPCHQKTHAGRLCPHPSRAVQPA